MQRTISKFAILLASCGLLACAGDNPDTINPGVPPGSNPGGASEDPDNTFEHPDFNPFDDYDQSGAPPSFLARVHSCPKVRYETLGRILASRGVDLAAGAQFSAGQLWRDGEVPLGTANYDARIRENILLTTSAATRIFDIFIAAAPEIEAALTAGTVPACQPGGVPISMFNGDACTIAGVECITGQQASASALAICNESITRADTIDNGKVIAMATLMAAAHTCE